MTTTEGDSVTTPPFTRIYNPGSADVGRQARAPLFVKAEWDGERLSVTGVEGPWANGNCSGSCGQVVMSYRTAEERAALLLTDEWTAAMVDELFDLWETWHLNDMQAGSPAQMAALAEAGHDAWRETAHRDHYSWAKAHLAEQGLQPDPGHLVDGEPYSYGSRWLAVEVPDEVLARLLELPAATREPAWV